MRRSILFQLPGACAKGAALGILLLGLHCSSRGASDAEREPPGPEAKGGSARSVCAQCPALSGGESSDFGGEPTACAQFEQRTPIDRERGFELGFDLGAIEQLVEREIDAPLRWTPTLSNGGGPAVGYETATRIAGRAMLTGSYEHVALDPELCEGTSCTSSDGTLESCSDRLELGLKGEFGTLDGAVNATATGYMIQGRDGFAFGDEPAGSLQANLRDVSGTLQVFPDADLSVEQALLRIDLYFKGDRIEGDLFPDLMLRDTPTTGVQYTPLSGFWPDGP